MSEHGYDTASATPFAYEYGRTTWIIEPLPPILKGKHYARMLRATIPAVVEEMSPLLKHATFRVAFPESGLPPASTGENGELPNRVGATTNDGKTPEVKIGIPQSSLEAWRREDRRTFSGKVTLFTLRELFKANYVSLFSTRKNPPQSREGNGAGPDHADQERYARMNAARIMQTSLGARVDADDEVTQASIAVPDEFMDE